MYICKSVCVSLWLCVKKRERERERERGERERERESILKCIWGANCNGRAFCSSPYGAAVTNESAASRIYSTLIKLAFVPAAEYQLIRPALSSQPQTHTHTLHLNSNHELPSQVRRPGFSPSFGPQLPPPHTWPRNYLFLHDREQKLTLQQGNKKWTIRRQMQEMYLFCRSLPKTRPRLKSNIDWPR